MALSDICSHPHFLSYLLYFISYFVVGCVYSGLGPLIPFFATHDHQNQTSYSYLFTCKAAGTIIGSVLCHLLSRYLTYNQILGLCALLSGIFCTCFGFVDSAFLRGGTIILIATFCAQICVFLNLAIIQGFKHDNLNVWIQINHGAFGAGGLLGPLIVSHFEMKTYLIFGCLMFLHFFPYFKLPSPEIVAQRLESQIEEQVLNDKRFLTFGQLLLMCSLFFLVIGQQSTFGGLVSSYAVMEKYDTKEAATRYVSFYWIFGTVFRFILPFLPGKSYQKLIILFINSILTSILSLILISQGDGKVGIILSSFLYGITNSIIYAGLFILPEEQKSIHLDPKDGGWFSIAGAAGEGTLVLVLGAAMNKFGNNTLFFGMGIMHVCLLIIIIVTVNRLRRTRQAINEVEESSDSD